MSILLSVSDLSFVYSGAAVLDSVSFSMNGGERVALLGPNGSGKSTLLKWIAGIHAAESESSSDRRSKGELRLNGMECSRLSPEQRARSIAYVASELRAEFPLTVEEVVQMGRISRGYLPLRKDARASRIDEALERCFCEGLRKRNFMTLSGGEKQRVAIARAYVQGASILLLDESLSKMDLDHQARMGALMKSLAREKSLAFIMVSHDVNFVSEWADRGLLLASGRLLMDAPIGEVMKPEALGKAYPGSRLVAGVNPRTGSPKIYFDA